MDPHPPLPTAAPRRRRWPLRLGLACAGSLATIAALELAARWTGRRGATAEVRAEGLQQRDPLLGQRAAPGAVVRFSKLLDGEPVFEVTCTIDEHGRRATPLEPRGARERFLLFFGDSFTFGWGVEDAETLPAQVGRLASGYTPYNYGFTGWGPQHALVLLEEVGLRAQVPEREGIAVYTFIGDHVARAAGAGEVVLWGGRQHPCYELAGGELVHRGSFASARPWSLRVQRLLSKSRALQRLGWSNRRLRERDFELATRILLEARRAFRESFGCERFVVLIFPGTSIAGQFVQHLQRSGIEHLDYSAHPDPRAHECIPGDGHPTPAAYAAVAASLVQDLGLRAP